MDAMRRFLPLLLGLALSCGGSASAKPDPLAFYPPAALARGVEGSAVLSCTINRHGRLEACGVVSENPAGWGFGDAALQLSREFQMRPQADGRASIGGATVQIPVRFQLPPESETPAAPN